MVSYVHATSLSCGDMSKVVSLSVISRPIHVSVWLYAAKTCT